MAWIFFGALPCRGKKPWWHLASRCCWNRARPWRAFEFVSFLVGLRTSQHPGMRSLPIGSFFTDIYGLKCCNSCVDIFSLLGCYAACIASYRRFGTTCWYHLQGSSRTIMVIIAILRCVKFQTIADLIPWLIKRFQQSQFFSWWKINSAVRDTLLGCNAARGSQ